MEPNSHTHIKCRVEVSCSLLALDLLRWSSSWQRGNPATQWGWLRGAEKCVWKSELGRWDDGTGGEDTCGSLDRCHYRSPRPFLVSLEDLADRQGIYHLSSQHFVGGASQEDEEFKARLGYM